MFYLIKASHWLLSLSQSSHWSDVTLALWRLWSLYTVLALFGVAQLPRHIWDLFLHHFQVKFIHEDMSS